MPGTTPKFRGLDNVFRENQVLSTDSPYKFFEGTIDPNTVDVQVSIRGAGFTSDPDLVVFEGTTFTIPNPSAYPEGLHLFPGDNVIRAKSVLTSGDATPWATVNARLSLERDVQADALPPTGVFIERKDRVVTINVEGIDDERITGYHFYASTSPGGGTVGYYRINPALVITGASQEEVSPLQTFTSDSDTALTPAGLPAADPLLFNLVGNQTDSTGNIIEAEFNENVTIPETVTRFRVDVSLSSVRTFQRFSFTHDRLATLNSINNPAIPNAEFNSILTTDPLYYVVTAVYNINGTEYESEFSPEVSGAPIILSPTIGTLPSVTRQQIVRDTVLSIQRSQPNIDVKPGSVTRDVFIDPFSSEAERIRFIVDFLHKAQAFSSLLEIDDPGNTGFSIPVSQSSYKTALKYAFFLTGDADVQTVINNAFDHLAARRGVTRLSGKRARGEITAYTTTRPTTTRVIPIGTVVLGGAVNFRTTSAGQISTGGAGVSYSPSTGRYSTRVFVQADAPGTAGNIGPGAVQGFQNGPSGVLATNESFMFGGTNTETNRELATRADGVLSSVDSGTYRGYTQTATSVPGVSQVNVVDAGHALMLRDIDPATGQHLGGMVDIWLKGTNLATVTDVFAFSFEIKKAIQFEPIGDLADLKFRAVDPDLSASNPIIEMLDYPAYGYEFENITTGQVLDLTDVIILPPDGIQLSADYNDPINNHMGDIFRGSYRYRTSDKYVFPRQPVRSIVSLTGDPTLTNVVSPTLYSLFHPESPLGRGRSTVAGDYLQVVLPVNSTLPTIPSGVPVQVTNEPHVLLGGVEYLENLGINPLSVVITSTDGTITYVSPYDPSVAGGATPDYVFTDESGSTPLGFTLPTGSQLAVGDEVLVSYLHDENFTVAYTTNLLVTVAQDTVNKTRHATADVLTKEGIPVAVDIYATIVVRRRQDPAQVDSAVRSALARLVGAFGFGVPLRQSDVIAAIENVSGVSYVIVPLTKLTLADESMIVQEVLSAGSGETFYVTNWSQGPLVDVHLLETPLDFATLDGGGPTNEFRGVFRNDVVLTNYETPPDINGVPLKNTPSSAFIIGNQGLWIPGYSDDATLTAKYPFATPAEIAAYRTTLTANRVLLALPKGETPQDASYTATYFVAGDNGVKSIEPGPVEYIVLGTLDFTYDEDTDFQERLVGRRR
jgi:hypothetical protein